MPKCSEYCIIDLTYFKKNKVAMRWRTEAEVRSGKGQFICGAKKCPVNSDLTSWEVNFCYDEDGEKKNALVKVRLCRQCSEMLNYGSQKRKVEKKRDSKKEKKKKQPSSDERKADGKSTEEKDGTSESQTLALNEDDIPLIWSVLRDRIGVEFTIESRAH
ncbi:unnamed protein product [Nippostrongylus brasiliensis]|uniref:Protein FRA10AC1 homolog n=1 Tax=Nippostrongylus brasiliensis TaxID=27835 RepID=A0A158QYH2_NIPBR|nr:unnamed protein product [Nippostrongylus brasiliensis]